MTSDTTLYTACDEAYLRRFGIAFAMAAALKGWTIHISAIEEDNQERLRGLLSLLQDSVEKVGKGEACLTWSLDQPWRTWSNPDERRVVLASNRFFTAEEHLRQSKTSLLIADIDALTLKPPQAAPPVERIGIFIRKSDLDPTNASWVDLGTAVNAGLVHIPANESGEMFLKSIQEQLRNQSLEWYADQAAIYICYTKARDKNDVFILDERHLGWEKSAWNQSLLWSAKGLRKDEDPIYKKKQKRMLRRFCNALAQE